MNKKNLDLKNFISFNVIDKKFSKNLAKSFDKISNRILKNLDSSKDIFHMLSKNFRLNCNLKDLKRFKKFNSVVIIGMGGSILGSEAIYQFLNHKIRKKFYFLNNLDETKIEEIKKKIILKNSLFLVISKSGNTIETISNLLHFNIIKKNSKNIVVLSEKKDNFLHSISKKYNLHHIQHKEYIGGRYSVLSEVGLIPAYLMGININQLRFNLIKYLKGNGHKVLKDSTIKLSNLLKEKRYTNLIFLNYSPKLEKFLYWCQQLIAESLGKNEKGFLPSISSAPKDHHSLLQLYLDGPKDKIFYIFSDEKKSKKRIFTNQFSKKFAFLNNKTLDIIKESQKNAFLKVLKKKNIPYRDIKIKKFNEKTLGELFSFFILETAIVGNLTKINPFNQPAVEQVKIFTKKLLN